MSTSSIFYFPIQYIRVRNISKYRHGHYFSYSIQGYPKLLSPHYKYLITSNRRGIPWRVCSNIYVRYVMTQRNNERNMCMTRVRVCATSEQRNKCHLKNSIVVALGFVVDIFSSESKRNDI